jgi:cyclopropane fatty-acyl-phospholipid synthase-like methyltransferase
VIEDTATYDVVYTSFALHHLPTDQKAEFFSHAAQRLEKDGFLLLVDVMREEDESLDVYRRRYCDWLRRNWTGLDAHEMDSVCDHLVNNDLPEPCSVLEAQAHAAGLGRVSPVARYGWHRFLCFTRA